MELYLYSPYAFMLWTGTSLPLILRLKFCADEEGVAFFLKQDEGSVSHMPLFVADCPLMKWIAKEKESERKNRKIN